MVERPLHAEGKGIDASYPIRILPFSSDWFPFETGVAFPEASDDTGLRPLSRKITRFPVLFSFWPLVSSVRPIRTVVPIVRSRIPGESLALRVTCE